MKKIVLLIAFSLFAEAKENPCEKGDLTLKKLKIIETAIEVLGKTSSVFEVIQEDGSRVVEFEEGGCFNVLVENETSGPTALHWHGLILPCLQDGVPYVTQLPIPSHGSLPYRFPIVQSGSYFAHSHYGLQEQKLMTIPLIFQPKKKIKEKQIVLLLEDFTFKSIDEVWQDLRKNYPSGIKRPWPSPFTNPKTKADLNDVSFDAYLTNRKVLENPEVHLARPGEKILLRIINASTASGFHIFLGELDGEIAAVDGNPVQPIALKEFPLATAQRIDVSVLIPRKGGAFPILAQAQGTDMRTGLIVKTQNAQTPALSSKAPFQAGAITNEIEKHLHAVKPLAERAADRALRVELEGNMKYYVWAINKRVWPDHQPLFVKEGERVEMEFINRSAMAHPMHLHGHVFQVLSIGNEILENGAVRDTVLVMPNQTVKVAFDAVHPGIWALHCHIAYHLWAGMFTTLLYENYSPPLFPKAEVLQYSQTYAK